MDRAKLIDNKVETALATWCIKNERRDIFGQCAKVVTAEDFSDLKCRNAWKVQQDMYNSGEQFGLMEFNIANQDTALTQWMAMAEESSPIADVLMYAEHISVLGSKRRYAEAISRVSEIITDKNVSLDECTQLVRSVLDEVRNRNCGIEELNEVLEKVMKDAQDLKNDIGPTLVLTGFDYIDDAGGLKEGDLDIIAGRTSNGKTAFATAIALNVAMRKVPVAFYSMEMTNEQLGRRIASMCSGIPARVIEQLPMSDEQFDAFIAGVNKCNSATMMFDRKRSSDIDYILTSIRQMVNDRGVRVVVIDYLQQLTGKYKDKRSLLSEACVKLKNLAVELKITIIALSQLARVKPDQKNVPMMSQLKECGEIENSADNVYMVYRAELYKENYPEPWNKYTTDGTALVINSKSRSSNIGEFLCGFNPECTLYYDKKDIEVLEILTTDDMAKMPS